MITWLPVRIYLDIMRQFDIISRIDCYFAQLYLTHFNPFNSKDSRNIDKWTVEKFCGKNDERFDCFLSEKASIVALFRQICYSGCTDWLHVNASSKPMRIVDQMPMRGRSMFKNCCFRRVALCSSRLFIGHVSFSTIDKNDYTWGIVEIVSELLVKRDFLCRHVPELFVGPLTN